MTTQNKIISAVAFILGIAFLFCAGVYFSTPAASLPTYMPGYDATMAHIHVKHAVGCLIIGVLLFVLVWFQSGKKGQSVNLQ